MEQILHRTSKRNSLLKSFGLLVLVVLTVSFQALAQTQIRGTVTDKEGLGIPGVSILEKGTQNGTITDLDGSYVINASSEDAILVFSFIGYKTMEQPVRGKSIIDLTFEEEDTLLEQVVVVGYGTQKKVNVTGAVDQLSGESIADRPIANVMQGLQGMSPGLNITYGLKIDPGG